MTLDLPAWLAAVDGVRIDRDGKFPAKDPYQCWDLWADYAERVVGAPILSTYTNAAGGAVKGAPWHSGYACNVFHNASRVPALASRFDELGPDAAAQPGDVAFWERGGLYAGSHVAIVVADRGSVLLCMSQNKGPTLDAAAYEVLSKRTLLGYLRPRIKASAPAKPDPIPPITREDRDAMALIFHPDIKAITWPNLVTNTYRDDVYGAVHGYVTTYDHANGKPNAKWAWARETFVREAWAAQALGKKG